MRFHSVKFRIIGNRDRVLVPEYAVVFRNHNNRIDDRYLLPYPVIVAIDIDTKKADLPAISRTTDDLVDIFGRDERCYRGDVMRPKERLTADGANTRFLAVYQNQSRIPPATFRRAEFLPNGPGTG